MNLTGLFVWVTKEDILMSDGNWQLIIEETKDLIGNLFTDRSGGVHRFMGVLHAEDDFYYLMYSMSGHPRLLSCVGDLDSWGFNPSIECLQP